MVSKLLLIEHGESEKLLAKVFDVWFVSIRQECEKLLAMGVF